MIEVIFKIFLTNYIDFQGFITKRIQKPLLIEYKFNNDVFSRVRREIRNLQGQLIQPAVNVNFNTGIDFFRYGAFVQVARSFLKDRLSFSGGLRTDMNNFTTSGNNPLETLSPRGTLSYLLSDKWSVNVSAGRYYKLPIYTILGFQDEQGNFANRDSKYTRSDHYVVGLEFIPRASTRFTLGGFWKNYANYPVSIRDGISLANQGGEFGAIGNESVRTNGKGRTYGFEFFFQQKLTKNIFAVFSYTFVRSEFAGINGVLVPSAWDNRHLVSALLGRKFNRGWEMGLKYRFAGGAPYTPFDMEASQRNFVSLGTGILDFNRLNTLRLGNFSQFDFRMDKKWNLRRTTIDLYFDVQNAFVTPNPAYPQFILNQKRFLYSFSYKPLKINIISQENLKNHFNHSIHFSEQLTTVPSQLPMGNLWQPTVATAFRLSCSTTTHR
jgi:hypothetical protein